MIKSSLYDGVIRSIIDEVLEKYSKGELKSPKPFSSNFLVFVD
jgi:hypothetical protein